MKPEFPSAQTNNRLKVKITELPDSSNAKLLKGSDEIVEDNVLDLDDNIKFDPVDGKYGLFKVKFKVINMTNVNEDEEYVIKFNVCYQYCETCPIYNEGLSTEIKCTTCSFDNYYINSNKVGVDPNRCYSITEKKNLFSNFYLNPSNRKFEECDISCSTCSDNANNCNSCNNAENYYGVDGQDEHTCFHQDDIENNFPNYYLDSPSSKYKRCHVSCKKCETLDTYCLECAIEQNYFLVEEELRYKCFSLTSINSRTDKYYLDNPPSGNENIKYV